LHLIIPQGVTLSSQFFNIYTFKPITLYFGGEEEKYIVTSTTVLARRSPKEKQEYILPSTLPQTLKPQVLFEFLKFLWCQ
jgi:hypothetical protein